MRICSLIPGATEVVAALDLADQLVGISHECDFPASIRHLPVMIEPLVGRDGTSGGEIDQQVKELVASGQRLYRLNQDAFAEPVPISFSRRTCVTSVRSRRTSSHKRLSPFNLDPTCSHSAQRRSTT